MEILSWEETREQARKFGQEHLIRHADFLSGAQKSAFMDQLQHLDFAQLQNLFDLSRQADSSLDVSCIQDARILREPETASDCQRDQEARALGEEALRSGRVAVILVAGGQGTRLGHHAPKGTYPIGPVTDRSLFQIHAEKVLALSRRAGHDLPLLIMTSQENDETTRNFFRDHGWFGLKSEQVVFFVQGILPVLDAQSGQVLLKAPGELAQSPNGHGGVIHALQQGGHLDWLERRGVTECFYFQVDNPLVRVADPTFLGHHLAGNAEMSLKVLAKLYPTERLGNLVQYDGRLRIIEYTELSGELAEERAGTGDLRIWAGSPAIHYFHLPFLQRLGKGEIRLPFHVARKATQHLDAYGKLVKPAHPNGLKFEMFVFDALPLAERAVAVEASRSAEFEPLKNATGENSPQSVRQALSEEYARWLQDAGVQIPRDAAGHIDSKIEISPLKALGAEDLRGKVDPDLRVGEAWVLQ
jgi:UDP-N-acetylglucosamine/UDP-N-acetylgalactosamine diphosphorylase